MEDPKKKPKVLISIKSPVQVSLAVLVMMAAAFTLAFGLLSSSLFRTTTTTRIVDETPTSTAYYCGDANGDNKVTSSDIIYLSQYLNGTGNAPTPLDRVRVDGDDDIDARDRAAILNCTFKGQGTLTCPGGRKVDCGTPFMCGDVNESKTITSADLVAISGFINDGSPGLTPGEAAKLDADLDIDEVDRDLVSDCVFKQQGTMTCPGGDKFECGTAYKCGDVNNDGNVTSADIIAVSNYINGTGSLAIASAGKLDGDNDIDEVDRWMLEDYVFHGGTEPLICPGGKTSPKIATATFLCGDANNDKTLNAADAIFITNYANGTGPAPVNEESANLNLDADITLDDATVLTNCIFKSEGTLRCHGGIPFNCAY